MQELPRCCTEQSETVGQFATRLGVGQMWTHYEALHDKIVSEEVLLFCTYELSLLYENCDQDMYRKDNSTGVKMLTPPVEKIRPKMLSTKKFVHYIHTGINQ